MSCFLYVTRFEVLLQSDLKVFIKHSQTPDFWKLRRNYMSLLTFHKCCTCYQPLSNPKASLTASPPTDLCGPACWTQRSEFGSLSNKMHYTDGVLVETLKEPSWLVWALTPKRSTKRACFSSGTSSTIVLSHCIMEYYKRSCVSNMFYSAVSLLQECRNKTEWNWWSRSEIDDLFPYRRVVFLMCC